MGEGVCQMIILLYKPYRVKVAIKGGGGVKISKKLATWFKDDPLWQCPLYTISSEVTEIGYYCLQFL